MGDTADQTLPAIIETASSMTKTTMMTVDPHTNEAALRKEREIIEGIEDTTMTIGTIEKQMTEKTPAGAPLPEVIVERGTEVAIETRTKNTTVAKIDALVEGAAGEVTTMMTMMMTKLMKRMIVVVIMDTVVVATRKSLEGVILLIEETDKSQNKQELVIVTVTVTEITVLVREIRVFQQQPLVPHLLRQGGALQVPRHLSSYLRILETSAVS